MGKTRKKKGKRWDHPDYKKGVYCFERDGYIHTYIFGERLSIKNLPWNKTNKDFAIQVLDKRVCEYFERENGFNSNRIDTFSELFLLYKDLKFQHLKENTKQTFLNSIKRIMGNNDFYLHDSVEITKFINSRIKEMKFKDKYSDTTINNSLTQLSSVFNFGIESDIITTNPIKSWLRIKNANFKFTICSREQLEYYLSELKKYIDTTEKPKSKVSAMKLYFTFRIIGVTGMRRDEVFKIEPWHIQTNKLLINGKNDRWREFPYSVKPELKSLLDEMMEFHKQYIKNSKYVLGFQSSTIMGVYVNNYRKMLNIKNVEEVKFHAVRKLVENEMMNNYSLNDNVVRSLIGHTIQTQSKHYINKMSAEDIEEVIKFNKNNT